MSSALDWFTANGGNDEPDPIERLRFFCSLAMNGQDWLDAEQFFDALTSAPTIPEGWQLVPKEPTEEMLNHIAGTEFARLSPNKQAAEIAAYSAMLSAAPKGDKP